MNRIGSRISILLCLAVACAVLALAAGFVWAEAPVALPEGAPSAPWWKSDKAPWIVGSVLAALAFVFGILLRPTLEDWAQGLKRWLHAVGFGFERVYLEALAQRHRHLKLVGVRFRTGVTPPKLQEVYVSLHIGSAAGTEAEADKPTELTVGEALKAHNPLVVLGEPGAGKSTLLSYLVLTFAGDIPQSRLGLDEKRLPIYVRLKDCVGNAKPIAELLAEPPVLPVSRCPSGFFMRWLKRGQCIVLLDGLDEVVDEGQKKAVAEKVKELVREYRNNRYIVTCRTAGWDANLLPGFVVLRIRDFNPAQVARFVHDWYKAVLSDQKLSTAGTDAEKQEAARQEASPEAQRRAEDLLGAIERNEGLARLSKNPLILSLIALVHFHRVWLPRRRAELYKDCLDVLLDQWDRGEHDLVLPNAPQPEAKWAIAEQIAYHFQTKGLSEADVTELSVLIASILKKFNCAIAPEDCLKLQIVQRSGLLVERAIGRYAFAHRTLQEYLAAKALIAASKPDELLAHVAEEPWREVVLLYVGMVGPTGATEVVKAILARPDDASCNMLLLAGQCLAEDARVEESVRTDCVRRLKGILDFVTDAGLLVRVASVLSTTGDEDMVKYFEGLLRHDVMATRLLAVEVLETVGKRVAPERAALALISVLMDKDNPTAVRHAAAVSLGQLAHPGPEVLGALRAARESDPSPGVRAATVASLVSLGQAEALKLVRVPAGEFLMGSDEYEDEKPPHKVYLDEYHIGRYPVTNAEFDRFVQDGGYRNSEWWTDAGEKWRGDRSDRERYGGVFDLPNHPVVGVTWYEAAAYARWAGMRLPAEAEWEKAARGTDGRQWPWGNTFDASRCNSYESWRGSRGLLTRLFSLLCRRGYISGGTTPVGQYSPDGDSPYGVTDMAGNVWEWCRTKWVESYKEYEKAAEDRENIEGEADRVVRGGSWRYDPGHVRAAYRFGYVPSHRDVLVGFRVVCAVAGAR